MWMLRRNGKMFCVLCRAVCRLGRYGFQNQRERDRVFIQTIWVGRAQTLFLRLVFKVKAQKCIEALV